MHVMSKTDIQLKQDIEAELLWDPKVNAAQIGVSVDAGAVCLFGAVDTYAARWAAEDATKRVSGVRTVAQELSIKLLDEHKRDDADIAAMVQRILAWNVAIPDTVTAVVRNGAVTLEGVVDWKYQREATDLAVRYLTGVAEVHNSISIKSASEASATGRKASERPPSK
jgi:osmotically-inducible protein OsmY